MIKNAMGIFLFLVVSSLNQVLAQTQLELNQDACTTLKKADQLLKQTYQKVLTAHKQDTAFTSQFKNAQRKWIAFRDAYVDSMYIPEYSNSYGSIMPMCKCLFIEQITSERIKQLNVWINGVQEGDACSGSA